MRLKMKNGSHRYDTRRYGHKYNKYKMCLSIMIFMCIKQHLSKIWVWIHEKIKQHWDWIEKNALFIKEACKPFHLVS